MANPEPQFSARRNYLSGSGCGCGCLGALAVLLGSVLLGVIPLGFYSGGTSMPMILGGVSITVGILVALVGVGMYIGALFME
jgi:hypothetical protein